MDNASTREGETDLVPSCSCHELNIADWPWRGGTIQVALCMGWRPYCAMHFSSCFELQYHIEEKQYRARKLKLVWILKSLPETSKSKKIIWVRFPWILSYRFETWHAQKFKEKGASPLKESGNVLSRKTTFNTNHGSKESYPEISTPEKTQKRQKSSSCHTISKPELLVSPEQIEVYDSKLYPLHRVMFLDHPIK
jgi:hypothetical protein